MPNYATSKQQFATEMIAAASNLLILAAQMDELNASFAVHGFASGGANAFVDTDFNTQNTHLSATTVNDTMFAIGTIVADLTTGVRNSLRECLSGGLPTATPL